MVYTASGCRGIYERRRAFYFGLERAPVILTLAADAAAFVSRRDHETAKCTLSAALCARGPLVLRLTRFSGF